MKRITSNNKQVKKWVVMALIGFCTLALVVAGAKAADSGNISAELKAFKVTAAPDGSEKLQATQRVKPGDVVEYQVAYQNAGKTSAKQFLATLPVPKGMAYIPDSTVPAITSASLDGKAFHPLPLMRLVRLSDGSHVQRQVPSTEYRFLRWELGKLDVGTQTTVRARVQVNR